jgi:hypothetical protein
MRCAGIGVVMVAVAAAADPAGPSDDAGARLSTAADASEYWDLTARFDSGYRLFQRFLITNRGPGDQTAAAVGYLVHPDGHRSEFRNARTKGQWRLSPDRLRIDVASSGLDLHAPLRRLEIDSHTQGVKISLQFPSDTPLLRGGEIAGSGFRSDVLALSAPVQGTIRVPGLAAPVAVRGTVTLSHAWMDADEARLVRRRIEYSARAGDVAFYLSDVTTPAGAHQRWLAVERNGALRYQTAAFEMTEDDAGAATADSKYPLPSRLLIHNAEITAEVRPQRVLLRANPLDAVPQPFRFVLSLESAPQRVWADASLHLTLAADGDRPPIDVATDGILAVDFLNPVGKVK